MAQTATKHLTLKKNFLWTLISNIIYAFSQWLILIIIAKIGTPEMLGKFSLGLAITAPIFLFTNLQLRAIQATDAKSLYKFEYYFTLRLISGIVAMSIISILVILINYSIELKIIIILVALTKLIESISDVAHGLMQKNERMDYISISKMIKSILSIFIFWITLIITGSLIYGVIGLAISWLIILTLIDIPQAKKFENVQLNLNISVITKLIKLAYPLGIAMMLLSVNTNIPRYALEYFNGLDLLGYFTSMAYIVVSGTTVVNALGQSASPRLAKYYALGRLDLFYALLKKLLIIGFIVGSLGVFTAALFGKQILSLVYTHEYGAYSNIFILIMISGLMMYLSTFMGVCITATRNFKVQPVLNAIWVTISLMVSLILIPIYGILGASLTLIVTSTVQFFSQGLFLFLFLRKSNRVDSKTSYSHKDTM